MGDERQTDEIGTELDDGANPSYEDGSPVEPEPAPDPDSARSDSARSDSARSDSAIFGSKSLLWRNSSCLDRATSGFRTRQRASDSRKSSRHGARMWSDAK